jgi:hypothetical protein
MVSTGTLIIGFVFVTSVFYIIVAAGLPWLRASHLAPAMVFDTLPPLSLYTPLILLVDFLDTVLRNITPPNLYLFRQMMGFIHTSQIYAVAELRIADHLAVGPKSAFALAPLISDCASASSPDASCEAVALRVTRLLRATSAYGVFREDGDKAIFQHTPASQFLRSDHAYTLRASALNFGGVEYAQMEFLPESIRTGKSSFTIRHGDEFWSWFEQHPDAHKVRTLRISTCGIIWAEGGCGLIVLPLPLLCRSLTTQCASSGRWAARTLRSPQTLAGAPPRAFLSMLAEGRASCCAQSSKRTLL